MEALTLRIAWSDWRDPEPARFDLLDMVDFCRRALPEGWSVRILNATGRIGGHLPASDLANVAHVEFRFPDMPSLAAFQSRFGSAVALLTDSAAPHGS